MIEGTITPIEVAKGHPTIYDINVAKERKK